MKIVLARKVWSLESVKYLLNEALQLRSLLKPKVYSRIKLCESIPLLFSVLERLLE